MSQEENSYAPYGYDSIWVLALALNQTMALLTKHNLSLHNFTYKGQQSRIIKESLHQSLVETRFIGMSVSETRASHAQCARSEHHGLEN